MENTFELLNKKFPSSQYALMEEVSDMAGFNRSRSADYMIMSLWPSRGLHLTGVERKSHRGDWLSELKNPKKAEAIFQYCNYFYLLTDNEGVAKREEIPDTWGWMAVEKGKIVILKEAPLLIPKEISMHFLAALLKRASNKDKYIRRDDVKEELAKRFQDGKDWNAGELNRLQKSYNDHIAQVKEFEAVSGIEINNFNRWNYDPKKVGEAVKLIASDGVGNLEKRVSKLLPELESLVKETQRYLSTFEAVAPPRS